MKLRLTNIGIIKEATIKLDGLTLIAGKNDSGKSTVGKILYSLVDTLEQSKYQLTPNLSDIKYDQYKSKFNTCIKEMFNNQIATNGEITFEYKNEIIVAKIIRDTCVEFQIPNTYQYNTTIPLGEFKVLMIETPFVWNIFSTLKSINNLSNSQIDFDVPIVVNDLYLAMNTKLKNNNSKIILDIDKIIKGQFKDDSKGNFAFQKQNQKIELTNTAMGIKYFGILQVLSNNYHFYKNQILILDEPEVHLHPTWQVELAKIIVYLVKKEMIIVVNSHSPYMIEALQKYAELENIDKITNFYIAQNGKIEQIENSNSATLSEIFEKLSEPFDTFEAMESERLSHG